MSTSLHSLLLDCNPKVAEVYLKLCPPDKRVQVNTKAGEFIAQGKSVERALADALFFYKLGGAVNA